MTVYWDCSTFIGRSSVPPVCKDRPVQAADLVDELARLDIEAAMAHHVLAHEYSPAVGNEQLLIEIADQPRLHPVWVVMPSHTGELPPPKDLVRDMQSRGVRLARMFPSSAMSGHRFALADWCAGELLDALETAQIPLVVDFTLFRRGEPPWKDVHDLCRDHRGLPLVLVDVQGRNNRTLYPLLEKFENLHVQTAGFNVHRGLEDVCNRFGPERLLFGSGFPVHSMGGARLHLERAELDDADRALIASGNLRRLTDHSVGEDVVADAR